MPLAESTPPFTEIFQNPTVHYLFPVTSPTCRITIDFTREKPMPVLKWILFCVVFHESDGTGIDLMGEIIRGSVQHVVLSHYF